MCQLEHQLFDGFFPGADGDGGGALGALMDPLCTVLYDALRPAFIQLAGLEPLCELVDILQHEARARSCWEQSSTWPCGVCAASVGHAGFALRRAAL